MLEMVIDRSRRRTEIRVIGDLDLASGGRLHHAVHSELDSSPRRVIVDLSEVDFIDSSGLRELVGATLESRADWDRLTIAPQVGPNVRRLLWLSGLEDFLPFAR
jgi:anti-sigma B factor antagonist